MRATRLLFAVTTCIACGPSVSVVEADSQGPATGVGGQGDGPGSATVAIGAGAGGSTGQAGGEAACTPSPALECYSGPAGTAGVGLCKPGEVCLDEAGNAVGCAGEVTPAAEDCHSPFDEDCDALPHCAGTVVTAHCAGGGFAMSSVQLVGAVASGSSVFAKGQFSNKLDVAGQVWSSVGRDQFVMKLDALGNVACAAHILSDQLTPSQGIAVDAAGDVYLSINAVYPFEFAGKTFLPDGREPFVAKFRGSDCKPLWGARVLSGAKSVAAYSVAPIPGGVAVAGVIYDAGFGAVQFGSGAPVDVVGKKPFVAKLDAGGTVSGGRVLCAESADAYGDTSLLASAADGTLIVAINWADCEVDTGGNPDVVVMSAELETLAPKWIARIGGPGTQRPYAVAVSPLGDVVATGSNDGTIDLGEAGVLDDPQQAWVVSLDGATGTPIWGRTINAEFWVNSASIAVDGRGDILVGGESYGAMTFAGKYASAANGSGFAAQLGKDGSEKALVRFDGTAWDNSTIDATASLEAEGVWFVGGGYRGSLALETEPSTQCPKLETNLIGAVWFTMGR